MLRLHPVFGADPATNPRLASVLATAKRAGFPKVSMDAAIARGQGVSASGAALETVTIEAILPPSIAFVLEIETDSRARVLMDIRHTLKKCGATVTPTAYLFRKRGKVVFEDERGLGVDKVLEDAIEAGAEDVETDENGDLVIWTDPSGTTAAAETMSARLGLKQKSAEVIWSANDDARVAPDEQTFNPVVNLAEALGDTSGLTIYSNLARGKLAEDEWEYLRDRITM
jgi:transcriptional/translational regulatory protein YebC/TACO1